MDSRIEIRPGRILNVRIYRRADADTTAFLIHGLGGRGDQWREQIDLLKQNYTLIIPDLLGHGKSEKPRPDKTNYYSFPELEQDIQELFNRYAGPNNIIFGHSYGGALTAALAINNQKKINRICLVTPLPCVPSFVVPLVYRLPLFMMEWLRPLLEKKFQSLAFDPGTSSELIDCEMRAAQANPMYVIKGMVTGMRDIPALDMRLLNLPAMVLMGENDKLVLPALQTQFYQALPQRQIVTIQHASHMVNLEKPQHTNRYITEFLETAPASTRGS